MAQFPFKTATLHVNVEAPVDTHVSVVHASPSEQLAVGPASQNPPLHTSPTVHPLLSALQGVPLVVLDQVVLDVAGLQLWQGFWGLTAWPAQQTPSIKQKLFTTELTQLLVVAEQESVVHAKLSLQLTLPERTHTPPWQVSMVQAGPVMSQAVPLGRGLYAVVLRAGAHSWQLFVGFGSPSSIHTPLIKHFPDLIRLVHWYVVALRDTQPSVVHPLLSLQLTNAPATQVPPWQESPWVHPLLSISQATPLFLAVHSVEDVDGLHC